MVASGDSNANGNGSAAAASTQLSTLPGPDHNWAISLSDKVIASEYSNHEWRRRTRI